MAENNKKRNFPVHTLEEVLAVPRKIQDEMAGKPFRRLLLADALGIKQMSSNFRDLLSSSYKYGLTEGTEKASDISLTSTGADATQTKDLSKRMAALRKAVLTPVIFRDFYTAYNDRKLPSPEIMRKLLNSNYSVPAEYVDECAQIILENGRFVGITRDIGGSPHVLLDSGIETARLDDQVEPEAVLDQEDARQLDVPKIQQDYPNGQNLPRAIFLGHGKKKAPLEKLEKTLREFKIPYKVAFDEPSLARPIPQKVRDVMLECNSAILIFTCDEKFHDNDGNEIWRPSENVVHELGAASFAYENRVVIFKERGLHLPTNFQSIGYIEFAEDSIEAKTTELLKELIGFGLVKVIPTA